VDIRKQKCRTTLNIAWISLLVLIAAGLSLAQASEGPSKGRTDYFACGEGFQSESGYSHRMVLSGKIEKTLEGTQASRYAPSLRAFSFSLNGGPEIKRSYPRGVSYPSIRRNLGTEKLELEQGWSPFIDQANATLDLLRAGKLDGDLVRLPIYMESLTGISGELPEVSLRERQIDGQSGRVRVWTIESKLFSYTTREGDRIAQTFDGLLVVDAEMTTTHLVVFRWRGSVFDSTGKPVDRFESYRKWYATEESGSISYPVQEILELQRIVGDFGFDAWTKLQTAEASGAFAQPPRYYATVFGLSGSTETVLSVIAEKRSNPVPVLAIIGAAHLLDGIISLGMNIVHDIGCHAEGCAFNPFDGDEESLLKKYVYENVAKGMIWVAKETPYLEKYGDRLVPDGKQAEAADILGDALHITVGLVATWGAGSSWEFYGAMANKTPALQVFYKTLGTIQRLKKSSAALKYWGYHSNIKKVSDVLELGWDIDAYVDTTMVDVAAGQTEGVQSSLTSDPVSMEATPEFNKVPKFEKIPKFESPWSSK